MGHRNKKYQFVVSPFFLGFIVLSLIVSALYIHVGAVKDQWIPAIISFVEIDSVSGNFSNMLALVFLSLSALSLYILNEKVMTIGSKGAVLPMMYLVFTLISPQAVYFSGASVAAFLIIWSVYYSIHSKNGEKEFFLAGFFIASAAIFEPVVSLMIPFVILFSFSGRSFTLRGLVTIIISVLIPFFFLLSLRYIFFQDALDFAEIFVDDIVKIESISLIQKKIADYAVLSVILLLSVLSLFSVLRYVNRYKIIKSMALNRFFAILISGSVILLLYPSIRDYFAPVIAVPVSVIITDALCEQDKNTGKRVIFLIMIIFILISRIAEFI
jgi:hypothetical protein